MNEAEIIVNGQQTINVKREFGTMNTADDSSIQWDGETSHIPKSQNNMWQNAPIKDEYMKDIQDVTMKEEPLEITAEEDWSNKISELPRPLRIPRLQQIKKDVVRGDCSSILAKALLPPISQKPLPKRRNNSSAIPRRRVVNNRRKKGKPPRPAKMGKRTPSDSEPGETEEENHIFVNGGERLTEEERTDAIVSQVASGHAEELPTPAEPLNLKVKCGIEQPSPNGPSGNPLLPEERIKLALRKILTRGFRAGAVEPDILGSVHSSPLPTLNLETIPQHAGLPLPKTPQLHSPSCEIPSSPEVQSPPLGAGPLSMAPLSPFEKTPLKTGYITDHDLLTMNVRELNQRFRDMPKTLRLKYKQRRRTLKNRQYAQNCRQKRASHRHEIESLNAILKAEVHRHQAEITRLIAQTGELRRNNERLKKNMDLLQEENLALKKDWMKSEGRPWLWKPGEKLSDSPQRVEPPMVMVNLAETPSIKSEPKQIQLETGEDVDSAELPQAAVEVQVGALDESEEEVDLERDNMKQNLKEDEERLQLLKERHDYECKSKKQQILLQQQQSLLQQQVRILQLLQLQQQRQLQIIQEPELQDLSFMLPQSVQSLKPDEERELHPPESPPSPEQPRSPQSQLARKSPKAKQTQLHKKSLSLKQPHKSQELPLSIQPQQLSLSCQSQLPRKCSKTPQDELPEKFQLSKQPHKSQDPLSSVETAQLSQPTPQSAGLQNPLLSQALLQESSASLLDPSLAMQLQSAAALLQTPNVVSGSLGSFYLVG